MGLQENKEASYKKIDKVISNFVESNRCFGGGKKAIALHFKAKNERRHLLCDINA